MEFVSFFLFWTCTDGTCWEVRVLEILVIGKLEFSETCEWENWNSLTEILILREYERFLLSRIGFFVFILNINSATYYSYTKDGCGCKIINEWMKKYLIWRFVIFWKTICLQIFTTKPSNLLPPIFHGNVKNV